MRGTKRVRRLIHLTLVITGLFGWLVLPGLPWARAITSAHSGIRKPPMQKQAASGLDSDREAAMLKLYSQLRAGAPFSLEEADILRRYGAGYKITELEADTVISRALYDYYITGNDLTREQQVLLTRYRGFAARRNADIADLKAGTAAQRAAATANAPPINAPLVPPNDTCGTAQAIPGGGSFPLLTTTVDLNGATTTGDPTLPSCRDTGLTIAHSVWYTFAPTATANYIIASCADAPTATTVTDTIIAIYTSSTGNCGGTFTEIPTAGLSQGCDDDLGCENGPLQAAVTTQLNVGTNYFIVVWAYDNTFDPANALLQLRVSKLTAPVNDTCAGAIALTLNTPVNGTTVGAEDDYELSGAACFTGVGQTVSTAAGRDVLYSFTAPNSGVYSFRGTNYFNGGDLVMYVASTCPAATPGTPVVVGTCLAAANRFAGSAGFFTAEEVFCVPLNSGQQVFIYVDEDTVSPGSSFTIEVTRCVRETEPNDTPATANIPACGIEGTINPATEADFFSLGTPAAGSRVFALIDGVAANEADFDLRVTTSTNTLEYDDFDADAAFGDFAPTVGGTPLTGAPSFLRVNLFPSTPASEPYRLYAVVQPPIGSATVESEPNNTIAQANMAANNYFSGSLAGPSPSTDVDIFTFTAVANDLIFLGLDCDPVRDNTPINGRLALLDSAGVVLLDVNDSSSISNTSPGSGLTATVPFSPAEGLAYRARVSGTYYARVTIGTGLANSTGSGDYLLSISKNCTVGPTAATFGGSEAASYDNGVLIKWQTGYEVDNLGFNIYREAAGQRVRLNPSLIAGSALMAGQGTVLTAGLSYSWVDSPQQGKAAPTYLIEELDLNGNSNWRGPVSISRSFIGKPIPADVQSALLSALGAQQAGATFATNPVERKAVIARATGAQAAAQLNLAGGPAVKISVKREGWYRVGAQELFAVGLSASADPRFLQLFVDGQEQSIIVNGEQDGRLDASDSIEFYGVGLDTAVTDTRVYWLVAGAQSGKRVVSVQSQGGKLAQGSFPFTVERKDRNIYFPALRNGDAENFFGPVIAADPVDQSVILQHVAQSSASTAFVEVSLQGVTAGGHQVKLTMNGIDLGDVLYKGQQEGRAKIFVSQEMLREGPNQVTLTALGGPSDVSLANFIRVTYQHSYTADSNALRLSAAGGQDLTVDGFTSNRIRVIDISAPGAPQELVGTIKKGSASYAVVLRVPGSSQKTLWAFADDRASRVDGVAANQPSSLKQPVNGADFVVVTRRDFFSALEPLKAAREAQGLATAVVDLDDVYDEFSFGQKTPQAIKDFLSYAKTSWKKKPRFAMFGGDASYDARNYLGRGDYDLVPSKLMDTEFLETASDDWLVDFNDDGLPDLAVGRLPARTAQEMTGMVTKIVNYEKSSSVQSALLVSDVSEGYDFESASVELRSLLPPGMRVEQINRGDVDAATAKSQLIDALNRGETLVNYAGHGSVTLWRGDLLRTQDTSLMTNERNLPLYLTMTCLNGYFQDPLLDSLAESLMKLERAGAVAVWASAGMGDAGTQIVLNREMCRLIFNGDSATGRPLTIGEAAKKAKEATADTDVRRTYVLFGDPTIRLR
jgi:predicted RecA/RadA family phage recombinase